MSLCGSGWTDAPAFLGDTEKGIVVGMKFIHSQRVIRGT
jgi:hypothetical protein